MTYVLRASLGEPLLWGNKHQDTNSGSRETFKEANTLVPMRDYVDVDYRSSG